MTTKSNLVPLKGRKNKKITELVNEIVSMLTSLTRDDLEKLYDEVLYVQSLIGELHDFIYEDVKKQKESEAKKAIKILINEGFSFEKIAIDDMNFEIDENKKIQVSNIDDQDDEIPF